MIGNAVRRRYLPEFVYGGIDGSITTFAVVAASFGASLNAAALLIIGFANLFADGFSMAVANYLSTKSHIEAQKGTKEGKFLAIEGKHPLKSGFATFFSFVLLGFIPLFSFVAAIYSQHFNIWKFEYSFILTGVSLVIVGAVKGVVVKKHPFKSAIETLIIGGIAAVIAFYVGYWLQGLVS